MLPEHSRMKDSYFVGDKNRANYGIYIHNELMIRGAKRHVYRIESMPFCLVRFQRIWMVRNGLTGFAPYAFHCNLFGYGPPTSSEFGAYTASVATELDISSMFFYVI